MGIYRRIALISFSIGYLLQVQTGLAYQPLFDYSICPEVYANLYQTGDYDELLLSTSTSFLELAEHPSDQDYWDRYEWLVNAYLLAEEWDIAYVMIDKGYHLLQALPNEQLRMIRFMGLKGYIGSLLGSTDEAMRWYREAIKSLEETAADQITRQYVTLNFVEFLIQMSEYGVAQRLVESVNTSTTKDRSVSHHVLSLIQARIMTSIGDRTGAQRMIESIDDSTIALIHQERLALLRHAVSLDSSIVTFRHSEYIIEWALLRHEPGSVDKLIFSFPGATWLPPYYLEKANKQREVQNYDAAIEYLKSGLKVIQENLGYDHIYYLKTIEAFAINYWALDRIEKAFSYFRKGSELYQLQYLKQFALMTEQQKEYFYQANYAFGQKLANFVLQYRDEKPELLGFWMDYLIRFKGLLFNYQYDILMNTYQDQDLRGLYEYYQYTREAVEIAREASYVGLDVDQIQLDSLITKMDQLERQLSLKSFFHNRSEGKIANTVSWNQVQQAIPDSTALIEIIKVAPFDPRKPEEEGLEPHYAFLKMDSRTKRIECYMSPSIDTDKYIAAYLNLIKFQLGDKISYRQLFQPIENHFGLNSYKHLLIVPDGWYHMINFGGLYDQQTSTYLLDRWDFEIYGNAGDLLKRDYHLDAHPSALFIGSPSFVIPKIKEDSQRSSFLSNITYLPGTKQEVQSIAEMFESRQLTTKVYLDDNAREVSLKNELNNAAPYGVVHIATHGFFNSYLSNIQRGKESGLLFKNASMALDQDVVHEKYLSIGEQERIQDDILSASEAASLNLLGADLVVLSACETGLGTIRDGEGVYGLHRSFQSAGAQQVIMSLWKVDDEATRLFMTSFYETWLAGESLKSAFRKAQEETRAQFHHPRYWAAFNLIGR